MKIDKFLMAACLSTSALVGAATFAHAEPFDVSASGTWTAVNPGNVVGLEGLTTNRIKWGTPADAGSGGNGEKSSYQFVGNNLSGLSQAQLIDPAGFTLGTFTHFNFIITDTPSPFSITGATLQVAVNFDDTGPANGDLNRNFTFNFTHNETPNGASPCPTIAPFPVPSQPCPDIVGFQSAFSEETVNIGGTEYVLQIIGFRVGNDIVENFLTTEGQQNDAELVARLTLPPPRASEPAALGLLGLGLAALGLQRRRRNRG